MWFRNLFGFDETSPDQVRANIVLDGERMTSRSNKLSFQFGTLEVPTLQELKNQTSSLKAVEGSVKLREVVGNIQDIHCAPENEHALIQAASQFNLLEMVGPHIIPEQGIDIYERDYTQGPACAIACGAGTLYRNYFAPVKGNIGQSVHAQIDCLELIGAALKRNELMHWQMKNGYALLTQEGLLDINAQLYELNHEQREELKEKLKIGIQWNTEVTISSTKQLVSQVYCSALPVAYSSIEFIYWENFARLILEATYEATLHAALINYSKTKNNKVYLTLVGGGAFGNEMNWILDSLNIALCKFKLAPLDVALVSYGSSSQAVKEFINRFKLEI